MPLGHIIVYALLLALIGIACYWAYRDRHRFQQLYEFLITQLPHITVFLYDRDMRIVIGKGLMVPERGRSLASVFDTESWKEVYPILQAVFNKRKHSVVYIKENPKRTIYQIITMPMESYGMMILRDVTSEKTLVGSLLFRFLLLQQSNKDLEQFAHIISHEMRTPLRQIASFADILSTECKTLTPEEAQYLQYILSATKQLQEVIHSLLVYAQMQTPEKTFVDIDSHKLVEKATQNLQQIIQERSAEIVIQDSLPVVYGDPVLLRQVFENLIENAIKFNTTGRKPLVTIWAEHEDLAWRFYVQDNGPGLDECYKDKAFTMFQRFHPNIPGTGVGLALCKRIVGIHAGTIDYTSNPNQGACFYFSIPPA